jgi:hypothetical protein
MEATQELHLSKTQPPWQRYTNTKVQKKDHFKDDSASYDVSKVLSMPFNSRATPPHSQQQQNEQLSTIPNYAKDIKEILLYQELIYRRGREHIKCISMC